MVVSIIRKKCVIVIVSIIHFLCIVPISGYRIGEDGVVGCPSKKTGAKK